MIEAAVLRRIHKILALAKDGIDGEQSAAQHQLAVLLQKHGLKLSDLEAEVTVSRYGFTCSTEMEKRLLTQIATMVLNGKDFEIYRRDRSRNSFHLDLTAAQHAEMTVTYEVLRKALKKELELSYKAFVQANDVFAETGCETPQRPRTPEEEEEVRRILLQSAMIDKSAVHRAIEARGVTL